MGSFWIIAFVLLIAFSLRKKKTGKQSGSDPFLMAYEREQEVKKEKEEAKKKQGCYPKYSSKENMEESERKTKGCEKNAKNETKKGIDLKKAIVYSTILDRPYK